MPHINDFGSAELLELMHFRDQAFASAAEEAERKIRFTLNKERLLKLEVEFLEQTDLLIENMTRAYNAEKKVIDLELKIAHLEQKINRLINNHLRDIEHMRSSLTWRIGYFFLTPLRLLRTLKRS
jgi:hypothetical protein